MTLTANKTIQFEKAMVIFKKFVATSQTRPVLTQVSFDGSHLVATNSHILIRVNAEYIEGIPAELKAGMLFDPKEMAITEIQGNYPETSRLIPNHANSTVILNDKNIKSFIDSVKAAKQLTKGKTGIIGLDFRQKELKLDTIESVGVYKDKKRVSTRHDYINHETLTNIQAEGEEIALHIDPKYLHNALDTAKKLSKLSKNEVEIGLISNMRPIVIKQKDVFEIILLPIRMIK